MHHLMFKLVFIYYKIQTVGANDTKESGLNNLYNLLFKRVIIMNRTVPNRYE
jgi:hypothetical protein